ncbi:MULTISPECIES: type IV pilin-like G/H family protein [unclassified Microcoleus]|nr:MULTISPECIES: type IV pilin-like G/H family protein [unclassified Microcoleus]
MQVKKNPQLDARNKQAASTTTMQVKTKPQLDALNKQAESTTTMQLKNKPELDAINQESESSAKTYQADLRPKKERKSVATTDRQDLQPIKNHKSVAKTYQPHFRPIKEHKSGGFTLVELIIVFMIIGILSAIALPSFLGCHKAKHSEAKQYVGSMNRAQQAYFAEKGAFSNSITALGLGIKTQTTNYNYSAIATKNAAFSYGVARSNNLRSYVGAVLLVTVSPYNDKTTVSILCEATSFGKIQLPNPILQNNVPVCAAGSSEVTK